MHGIAPGCHDQGSSRRVRSRSQALTCTVFLSENLKRLSHNSGVYTLVVVTLNYSGHMRSSEL